MEKKRYYQLTFFSPAEQSQTSSFLRKLHRRWEKREQEQLQSQCKGNLTAQLRRPGSDGGGDAFRVL